MVGRRGDWPIAGGQTGAGAAAVVAATEPAMASARHRDRCTADLQCGGMAFGRRSDELRHPHAAVYLLHSRLLQQLDSRQRRVLRPADLADYAAADSVCGAGDRGPLVALPVLPHA